MSSRSELQDERECQRTANAIAAAVEKILLDQGETTINPDTVAFLADLAQRFISDISHEVAFIHHNAGTPGIEPAYVQHVVRNNPAMIEILSKYNIVKRNVQYHSLSSTTAGTDEDTVENDYEE